MKRRLALLAVVLIIIDLCSCVVYYKHVQKFLFEQPPLIHADAAVVFMGHFDEITYELSSETKKRLDHAKKLYQSGKVNGIICVGGYRKGLKYPGSQIMKYYLVENNVPEGSIFNDSLSYDTETNWIGALKIMKSKGFNSMVAVSSPVHLYRISMVARWDSVFYSPYPNYLSSWSNYLLLCKHIHHEWLALSMRRVLPENFYHQLIRRYRKASVS